MKTQLIKKRGFDLKFPIKIDSNGNPIDEELYNQEGKQLPKYTEITRINIYRMRTKHLKLIPDDIYTLREGRKKTKIINPEKLLPLIGGLTGLTKEQVGEIDMVDLIPITDEIMSLVGEVLDQTA
jgi:hypothetical protein